MEDSKTPSMDDEINLLDYLIVLLKRKNLIFLITLAFAVITATVSLILPEIYKAEVRLLPPQQSNSMASQVFSQFTGNLMSTFIGSGGSGDLYAGMIQGRTVLDRIIDRFDLMHLYEKEHRIDAREELKSNISVTVDSKSGIVSVTVEDKDPVRAADMANAFVEELKNLTKGLAISEASQRRLFFEEQLRDTKNALTHAEEAMQGFQERTGVLKVEEQAKAVIEGIAQLRAQIAAKEVEIKVMKTYATSNNPDLLRAEEALKGMKSELSKLEAKGGGYDPLMPTGRMPSVGTEYVRKLRDLKFNETLFELLVKQYEMARIDEARDMAVIQIVDVAVPPDKRAKPKRTLMVIAGTFLGLLLALFIALLKESYAKLSSDPLNRDRVEALKRSLYFRRR